jgi:double-stranded uracil-DNA glycosylase
MRKAGLPPVVAENTEILILGTLPSDKSLAAGQYYANRSNDFWKLVGEALHRTFEDLSYEAKIELLKANRIGLWDAYHSCIRPSSMDCDITQQELNDFGILKRAAPNIRLICFNGQRATEAIESLTRLTYQTVALPSSSGANRRDQDGRLVCWKSTIAPRTEAEPHTVAHPASIHEIGATMSKPQTLFGDGCAVVVGLPKGFNMSETFRSAKEIRLATAFAHVSGWKSLKPDIEASSGDVFLLTGLQYNQTEPALLKQWLNLKLTRKGRVNVKLASRKPFFHPKVLIVRSPTKGFAIVGSGNLSSGGLRTNCECGVYVGEGSAVKALCAWFDEQFDAGNPVSAKTIEAYEPEFKKAQKQTQALAKHQQETERKIDEVGEALLVKWNRALRLAEAYFHSKDFNAKYTKRKKSAKLILKYLNAPTFEFDEHGWFMFYQQTVLGALDSRSRDRVFKVKTRLRRALREMYNNP